MHETPRDRVAALLSSLNARAAGLWLVEGERLAQVAFVPCAELADEAARGFAEATLSVPLAQPDLGIVRAVLSGDVAVSRTSEFSEATGSGRWLRAFDAERSVAVPLRDEDGTVRGVFSVAMPGVTPDDGTVADQIRAAAEGWDWARGWTMRPG